MTDFDPERWEAFLIDVDGFTVRDDERAVSILRLLPDEQAIEGRFDDCLPDSITVCRRDAKPQPQQGTEDEGFLRIPSARRLIDFIDIDVRDEDDPERAVLLWIAARGAAEALNKIGGSA